MTIKLTDLNTPSGIQLAFHSIIGVIVGISAKGIITLFNKGAERYNQIN